MPFHEEGTLHLVNGEKPFFVWFLHFLCFMRRGTAFVLDYLFKTVYIVKSFGRSRPYPFRGAKEGLLTMSIKYSVSLNASFHFCKTTHTVRRNHLLL